MSDQSKVNIDALAAFGKDVGGMLKDYSDGLNQGATKIGDAVVGFSGTNEAQVFKDWYYQAVVDSSNKFNQDVVKGLLSMSYGAIVEAANYREGDLSQSQALRDVQAAFDPKAGTQSVATDIAKSEQDHPQPKANTTDQLPPPAPTPDNVCLPPSPMEQVRIHNDLYGKDERWHPDDPNAKPNVQLVDPPPPGGWPDTSPTTQV